MVHKRLMAGAIRCYNLIFNDVYQSGSYLRNPYNRKQVNSLWNTASKAVCNTDWILIEGFDLKCAFSLTCFEQICNDNH